MSVDDALRRWRDHDRPATLAEIFKAYRLKSVSEVVARMMLRHAGEAFRAGWRARERIAGSQGDQSTLFGSEDG